MPLPVAPDLGTAGAVVREAEAVTAGAARHLAGLGDIDEHQVAAYDLAHAAAAVESARAVLDYGGKGEVETQALSFKDLDALAEQAAGSVLEGLRAVGATTVSVTATQRERRPEKREAAGGECATTGLAPRHRQRAVGVRGVG